VKVEVLKRKEFVPFSINIHVEDEGTLAYLIYELSKHDTNGMFQIVEKLKEELKIAGLEGIVEGYESKFKEE